MSAGGFMAPALIFTTLFYLLPNLLNLGASFTIWTTYTSGISFAGVQNFIDLGRSNILPVIWLTARYAAVAVAAQTLIALILALCLERSTFLNGLLRAVFFLPVLISPLAAGYIWQSMLDPEHGLVNRTLTTVGRPLGFPAVTFPWLGTQTWTIYIVGLVYAWKWVGLTMLIFLAGLKAIPVDAVEAARSDGAGWWQIIWRVKLPLLMPALTFNVTINIIGALTSFDLIMAITKGGPGVATTVFNVLVLSQLGQGQYGYAATISLTLSALVACIALPVLVALRRREVQL